MPMPPCFGLATDPALDTGTTADANPRPLAAAGPRAPGRAERELGIDALRGLAVFTMVGANMVPYLLAQPYPFWLRLYSSLAAPIFILLAGFMAGQLHVRRPAPLSRQLKRTLALLLVASLIDLLLWGDIPFSTFDVLYLIALVVPAAHLALRAAPSGRWGLVAAIFLLTPLLRLTAGYESAAGGAIRQRLQAMLVDGWFPVFPWLGVGLLGATLGAHRQAHGPESFTRLATPLGALLSLGGAALWWLHAPRLSTAGGFAELFYPPTLGVLFTTLGPELLLLVLLAKGACSPLWQALAVFGRVALAMYIAHIVIIALVIKPYLAPGRPLAYATIYLALAAALWLLAVAIRRLCPAPRSFWGRLLLGG